MEFALSFNLTPWIYPHILLSFQQIPSAQTFIVSTFEGITE